jgi:hypothetical protein
MALASAVGGSEPARSELLGTWYLLIHYRDASSRHPEQWRWEDRVWQFHHEGENLVWTEYLLVNFVDESGRFTDLGTNMAARVPGAWEPNPRQRKQIETGLGVAGRSARRQRLAPSESGDWQSVKGAAALSRLVEDSIYLSSWSIGAGAGLPVFLQTDRLSSAQRDETLGSTRYRVESRDAEGPVLRGSYQRDGIRAGRFRLMPARLQSGGVAAADEQGRIPLLPGVGGVKGTSNFLLSFLRPWYYHGERLVRIETIPANATLDLAYLRRGTQLLYAEARAPATVLLPARITAAPQDVLRVRAQAPGYGRESASVVVRSRQSELRIDLEPLPNTLRAVGIRTLGRGEPLMDQEQPSGRRRIAAGGR